MEARTRHTPDPASGHVPHDGSPPPAGTPPALAGQSTAGLRVLLVDDSRTMRESARSLLEDSGCQLTLASNGFEALCQVAVLRPHLVFMDIAMPELDGFQACALIRASARHGATPVVLVSANDGRLDRARAELVGAQRYILKPFRKADLLAALRELVPGEAAGRGPDKNTDERSAGQGGVDGTRAAD
jgi:twitching motility two-component system response regulator PilG